MKNSDKVSDAFPSRATRQRYAKETRAQMMERLTNPLLSLHEAGVILNVCASTLRRYTDSGILPHERTAGGQRRFRLNDVLALLDEREEQRQAARRQRRTRGRIRGSQVSQSRPERLSVRVEPNRIAAQPQRKPVLSLAEQRRMAAEKVLHAAQARVQKFSQAAAQKNAVRTTPPPRISLSRLAALGRREMDEERAQQDED